MTTPEYPPLPEPDATTYGLGQVWNRYSMRAYADATDALRHPSDRTQAPARVTDAMVQKLGMTLAKQHAVYLTAGSVRALLVDVLALSQTEQPEAASIHLEDLKRETAKNAELCQQLRLMEEHAKGEVWRWQGDGTDDLASMGNRMGVLICASDLRALLANWRAEAQRLSQMADAAMHQNPNDQRNILEVLADRLAELSAIPSAPADVAQDGDHPPLEPSSVSAQSRALLLNVLWHHQGGSSRAGQPIRRMLGISQHADLTGEQVAEAKRIEKILATPGTESASLGLGTPLTGEQRAWLPFARGLLRQAGELPGEDAGLLDFLVDQQAIVVSDPDIGPGFWLEFNCRLGEQRWVQVGEFPTPRAAIQAARNPEGSAHEQ